MRTSKAAASEPVPRRQLRRYGYAVTFALLGVAIGVSARRNSSGLVTGIGVWTAGCMLILALAYFFNFPAVFGKTSDGRMRLAPAVVMLPFLLFTWIVWTLQNRFVRTAAWNHVAPGLFLGRRCGRSALPPGTNTIVDVTAEFPSPWSVRQNYTVVCVPTLDGCAPRWRDCLRVFDAMQKNRDAVIYVCCANGYGRSVTIVAALLGLMGVAESAEVAVEIIKRGRAAVAPNSDQRQFLESAFRYLSSTRPPGLSGQSPIRL